ncbi:MAG TPA: GAF domain-containing protein [Candidatus Binatus sp.]|nr:GAF domain-containing protein [Candidatus Binatus sp.]
MAVMTSALQPVSPNRRRRVRHRIQTPAYASFTAESKGAMLDLHEIVDISEDGASIHCHATLEVDQRVNLCLDLADCAQPIYTSGQVVWTQASGRAGLRFSQLSPESVARLREWLFVNVMAGVANGEAEIAGFMGSRSEAPPRPNYTDTLAAVSAVQRQAEALGADLAATLQLIADRAQTLVRASGAAIALAGADPDFMICRASAGPDSPPVGAPLQVGSGFSGECVRSGKLLLCDDSELDLRVDRENCRALGIRSILAAPVLVGEKSIGLIEVFSAQPHAFSETDSGVLRRLVETVLAAVNRAARAEDLPLLGAEPATERFAPTPGSVLFASAEEKKTESADEKTSGVIHLPGSPLIILGVALALTFLALGYNLAPWIQSKLHDRGHSPIQTVLASSHPPKSDSPSTPVPSTPAIETASFAQLQQMAQKGDSAAANAVGLRYATGDGIRLDEKEAVRWFTKAAEQGNVAAQSKLGSIYLSGRGTPPDFKQAYFWMVLARANGDEASKVLAPIATQHLTREQITSIELDADRWLQQHRSAPKPAAGR